VQLVLADLDARLAADLAHELDAQVVDASAIMAAPVDVLAPCAVGGLFVAEEARMVRAWAVCGAANNLFADDAAEEAVRRRGVLVVPDVIASAGAVIEGIGRTVMGLPPVARAALIDGLSDIAREVLFESSASRRRAGEVARSRAAQRLAAR
jgi:hypothetical protein